MSTCISREGEYDEHQTEPGNYICDLCGVLDEEGIFTELDRLRTENETLRNDVDDAEREWGQDIDRLRTAERALEQAEARIEALTQELALVRDTLNRRTDALNRTGTDNDTLRATLASVEALMKRWDDEPYPKTGDAGWNNGYNMRCEAAVDELRAILDDQETK